jgi:hypothetical protein
MLRVQQIDGLTWFASYSHPCQLFVDDLLVWAILRERDQGFASEGHLFGVQRYSVLSVCIGSTDAARRAGSRQATVPTASSIQIAAALRAGS